MHCPHCCSLLTISLSQFVYTDSTIVNARIDMLANDDICWYMDSNTCESLMRSDFDVEALVVAFYLVFLTTGIILLLYTIVRCVRPSSACQRPVGHLDPFKSACKSACKTLYNACKTLYEPFQKRL